MYALLTIAEIAHHWGKHYRSVERALDRGRYPLRGRQTGPGRGCWLISRRSVELRWGKPVVPLQPLN